LLAWDINPPLLDWTKSENKLEVSVVVEVKFVIFAVCEFSLLVLTLLVETSVAVIVETVKKLVMLISSIFAELAFIVPKTDVPVA
jgi:hypothetical protein